MSLAHSDAAVNAALDTILDRANASTAQTNPIMTFAVGADPGVNNTTDTGAILATLNLPTTAFAAASARSKSLAGVPLTATVQSPGGTPGHYRVLDRSATRLVAQAGTVGVSGADINFATGTWLTGGTITLSSYIVNGFN